MQSCYVTLIEQGPSCKFAIHFFALKNFCCGSLASNYLHLYIKIPFNLYELLELKDFRAATIGQLID